MDSHPSSAARGVERIVRGRETSDGAGVRLTRIITQDLQRRLDPFLMLDLFHTDSPEDYIGGFPDHPHRGFETVTYMLSGRMRHRDSAGNSGLLEPGGAQWMTAGSGLVHSEMPEQVEGLMEGFQLWLNLPAASKMQAPHYRDLRPEEIPEVERDGARVRVVAGCAWGTEGPLRKPTTDPLYLDVELEPGRTFSLDLEARRNAFVLPFRGTVRVGGTEVASRHLAILDDQGGRVEVQAPAGGRFLLVAGTPLEEPIASYGPFVMNSAAEIEQAFRDYRDGKFEAAAVARD